MSRNLWFVSLLLATGVVLADETPKEKPVPAAPEPPAQTKKDPGAPGEKEKAEQAAKDQAKKEQDAQELSGMSILGNQEAPKALVIVPWKSSELADAPGISPMLDDSRLPVDKEVFMRALGYYEIRSESTRHNGAPAGGVGAPAAPSDGAQSATSAHRRKS